VDCVTWTNLAIAAVAFALMEPITAATHRWVMHGIGEFVHRSHHRPRRTRWESNDWYPVAFAAVVNLGFFAGFNWDGYAALVPVGIGVTIYGGAYAFVHDVYIHRRLGWFADRRLAWLDRLAEAHRIHHLYSAAPYGMLVPIVPADLRERARRTERNPIAQNTKSPAVAGPV
jgi:beta-carotene 3-hydroxylase